MNEGVLRILAVDDQEFDAEALRRQLARIPGLEVEFVHRQDPDEALDQLRDGDFDVVFMDYRLDGALTGLDLVKTIRESGDIRPVVVLTGQGDEYLAADITRCGADEYIVKSDLDPGVLRRAIDAAHAQYRRRHAERELARRHEEIQRLTDELAAANVQLAELTRRDCLTNLLNRRAWEDTIRIEHERAVRHGRVYGVIMFDVDHFKQFNDTQGHQRGDDCLRRLAHCLDGHTRNIDFAGRYGGEEFVILCSETSLEDARLLAERLRAAIFELQVGHPASPTADRVTASFGVAAGPADSWEEVVRWADEALYRAKEAGRNRVCAAADGVPCT